jgi:hypothetical protein
MLIATITALILIFGGGGSLENYLLNIKKPAKAAVEEKATVKELVSLSKDLGKQLKTANKDLTELQTQFVDLHAKQNLTQQDFEPLIDAMLDIEHSAQQEILDTREAMKKLLTEDEWQQIFATDNR